MTKLNLGQIYFTKLSRSSPSSFMMLTLPVFNFIILLNCIAGAVRSEHEHEHYKYLDIDRSQTVSEYESEFDPTLHTNIWSYACGGDTLAQLSDDKTMCQCNESAVVMMDPSVSVVYPTTELPITSVINGLGQGKPQALYSHTTNSIEPDREYPINAIGQKICQPHTLHKNPAPPGQPQFGFKFTPREFDGVWKDTVYWSAEKWQLHINATFDLIQSRCKHCSLRKSLIFLAAQPVAGLTDRMVVLQKTANMASAMCARIVVPQPCVLLARMHNLGKSGKRHLSPCNHRWNKYFKLTFENDGSEVISGTTIDSHRILEKEVETIDVNGLVVIGKDVGYTTFLGQFQRAVSAFASGQPFLWKIDIDYYRWGGLFGDARAFGGVKAGEDFPYNCDGTKVATSELAIQLRDDMLRYLELSTDSKFITIHIRRGDTSRRCRYTEDKVVEITECILSQSNPLADFPKSPVIFFTDEKNKTYINQLQGQLKAVLGRPVYWGDVAIRGSSTLSANLTYDNHLVFAASRAVQTTSTAHIEMLGGSNTQSKCATCKQPSRGTRGF